jgi:hypothetical protein
MLLDTLNSNMFRIKQSYRVRHKILDYLFQEAEKERNPQVPTNRISSIELSKKTKIPIEYIDLYHESLNEEKEIDCCFTEKLHKMLLTSKGRQSFIDKKYIKEGRKAYWDNLYDPLKIILPTVSILLAGFALYLNSNSSKKIDSYKIEVESLKNSVQILSDSVKKITR